MAGATITNPSQRVNEVKGEILAHAIPTEVLGITGSQKKMPRNQGDNISFRRFLPYGGATTSSTTINQWVVDANSHLIQEGVTPDVDNLVPQDINVVLQQYGCLYMYTDKVELLHEDDIPAEMKKQVGERMGLVREMIRYGALKQCTNVYYAGGTSLATVDEVVSKNLLSKVTRSLKANHAKTITGVLAASPGFNTSPIQAAYLVFAHTDTEHDIREIPGFVDISQYGSKKPVHEEEIGSVGRYRFVLSPELSSSADSGAAVAGLGLKSTTGTSADLYPMIVVGEDAWGDVALRGKDSFDMIDLKPGNKDKSDPAGQRGYAGATFWSAATVLNSGWMALVWVAVTDI
jgi:N4-gp56 family major capsid protein